MIYVCIYRQQHSSCITALCPFNTSAAFLFEGVPLLVLGNKNDLPGALDSQALSDRLELKRITDREVAAYSISCKRQTNIDNTLDWLTQHAK